MFPTVIAYNVLISFTILLIISGIHANVSGQNADKLKPWLQRKFFKSVL